MPQIPVSVILSILFFIGMQTSPVKFETHNVEFIRRAETRYQMVTSDKRVKRGVLDKLGQIALTGYHSMTGDPCSVRKFWAIYLEVSSLGGCDRCDKYFHCRANYDAVHACMIQDPEGNLLSRIRTAEEISNAREFGQNGTLDSEEDQMANKFGRGGGNCAEQYLDKYGCFYDPWQKICRK